MCANSFTGEFLLRFIFLANVDKPSYKNKKPPKIKFRVVLFRIICIYDVSLSLSKTLYKALRQAQCDKLQIINYKKHSQLVTVYKSYASLALANLQSRNQYFVRFTKKNITGTMTKVKTVA